MDSASWLGAWQPFIRRHENTLVDFELSFAPQMVLLVVIGVVKKKVVVVIVVVMLLFLWSVL